MSLNIENENRLLKETIIELRTRLDALYMEMQKKVEMERVELGRINLQLEAAIQSLRDELVNSDLKNRKKIEELRKANNLKIYQLQNMISEMRKILETNNGVES
jgi:hypothetical protein